MTCGHDVDCEQSLFVSDVDLVSESEARARGNLGEKSPSHALTRSLQFLLANKIGGGKTERRLAV